MGKKALPAVCITDSTMLQSSDPAGMSVVQEDIGIYDIHKSICSAGDSVESVKLQPSVWERLCPFACLWSIAPVSWSSGSAPQFDTTDLEQYDLISRDLAVKMPGTLPYTTDLV